MAKTLYDAGYQENGEPKVVPVDIFDLPYDKFSYEDPLWIMENVDMGKSKNQQWPDFSNVGIAGTFDCSNFTITADTVLPFSCHKLVCKYSINDLDVLIGKVPTEHEVEFDGQLSIVVRPAILNNIKKQVPSALDAARRFARRYPQVVVTDGKQTLSKILEGIERNQQKSVAVTPVEPAVVATKPQIPVKTADWLSTDELAEECVYGSSAIENIDHSVLCRYLQQARSQKAGLPIRKQEMIFNGAKITCVHIDGLQIIIDFVESQIIANQERVTKAAKKSKKDVSATEKTKREIGTVKKKCYAGDTELKRVKIKKYILDSVWKDVCSACRKNKKLLLQILLDVDAINVIPKKYDEHNKVYYIKPDGTTGTMASLEYKSPYCFCQGFGSQKTNQRIVWGVSGSKFIAQYFFPQHDGDKVRTIYNQTIRTIDAGADYAAAPEKYLLLSDLLDQFTGRPDDDKTDSLDNDVPETISDDEKADASIVENASTPEIVDSVDVPSEQSVASQASTPDNVATLETVEPEPVVQDLPHKGGRPRIIRKTVEPTRKKFVSVKPVDKPEPKPEPKTEPETEPKPESVASQPQEQSVAEKTVPTSSSDAEWTEMYSVSYQYTERLQILSGIKTSLLMQMQREQDTCKLLAMSQELQNVLQRTIECESALNKIQQMQDVLQKLRSKLDGYNM